jgi:SAM-dependent methyltransferase
LGDDAEFLATLRFDVTAFDISPTAIDWCRRRFPNSKVRYQTVDVFRAPAKWQQAFDFVFEAYTVQVFPGDLRERAARLIGQFVRPGGTLLVVARGRDPHDDPGQMPWPLTRAELTAFAAAGLREVQFEDYLDAEDPPVRRFRVAYRRD